MQQTTLTASTLGLALAAGTLRASTADHSDFGPPSASPNTKPGDYAQLTGMLTAAAQIADELDLDLDLLAQGGWDAEEEAMLAEMMEAEMLAEYE